MLGSGSELRPALVRGILPSEEATVSDIDTYVQSGRLDDLQAGSQRLIIGRVLAINLDTGDRTVITDGSGPALDRPSAVQIDRGNQRMFILDNGLRALVSVDLTSYDRTIVSQSGTAGTGPAMSNPEGLRLDLANNRALVVDSALRALLAIDLTTGARTVLSSDTVGTGPAMLLPLDKRNPCSNNHPGRL